MRSFLRCSDTRANRGTFLKSPHYFRVIGVFDLRKRHVAPIRHLRGNRRSGVFSSCGVRYNPNRCESNLLVRAFLISPIGHALCLGALYVSLLLWLSSRSGDVVPYAVCVGAVLSCADCARKGRGNAAFRSSRKNVLARRRLLPLRWGVVSAPPMPLPTSLWPTGSTAPSTRLWARCSSPKTK